jgi:hypothetical protein
LLLFKNRHGDHATKSPVLEDNLSSRRGFRSLELDQQFATPLEIAQEDLRAFYAETEGSRQNRGLDEPQDKRPDFIQGAKDQLRDTRSFELSQEKFRDQKSFQEVQKQPRNSRGFQGQPRSLRLEPEQPGWPAQEFQIPENGAYGVNIDSPEDRSLNAGYSMLLNYGDQSERSLVESLFQNDPNLFR